MFFRDQFFINKNSNDLVDELKQKNVSVFRDVQEKDAGKNAIIVDPDDYMISLFEPNFISEKNIQTGGYIGFTLSLIHI